MKKLLIAIIILGAIVAGGIIYFSPDNAKETASTAIVEMTSQSLDTATAKAKEVASEAATIVGNEVNDLMEAVKETVASASDTAEKLTDKTTERAKGVANEAATKVGK